MEASRKKEDKASLIIDAMSRCVARYGASGATFEHVAAEAGVSRGLLHYYFGTKEQLLVAVVRRHAETIADVVRKGVEVSTSLEEGVANVFHLTADLARHDPEIFMITYEMLGEGRRNEELGRSMAELGSRARDEIQRGLEFLQSAGMLELRHTSKTAATTLVAMADGLALHMLERPDEDHEPTIAAMIDVATRMLAPRSS